MQKLLSNRFKKYIPAAVTLAVVLAIVSGYLAYSRIYLTNERRFWRSISNNLSLYSVTRTTENGGTGNKSIEQTRFSFGANPQQNKISSISAKNATTESNVTTQTITTPKTQYVKYLEIFSTEKKQDGSTYDFSSIKNIWAKQDEQSSAEAADQQRLTFEQSLITLAPFGNLTASAKRQVMSELFKSGAYQVDYKRATHSVIDNEKFITYSVKVQTKKYVTVLQNFLTVAGYGSFPPLQASNYPENARLNAEFIVKERDNSLAAISYNGSTEKYSGFGVLRQADLPKNTISTTELQAKLQSAQ